MTIQLEIPYETLLELVEQLSEEQKQDLLMHLLKNAEEGPLTKEEKLQLWEAAKLSVPVNEVPSIRVKIGMMTMVAKAFVGISLILRVKFFL